MTWLNGMNAGSIWISIMRSISDCEVGRLKDPKSNREGVVDNWEFPVVSQWDGLKV